MHLGRVPTWAWDEIRASDHSNTNQRANLSTALRNVGSVSLGMYH